MVLLQVGNYIQHKGGVVTAEELAPYLDVPPGKDLESTVVDESYVVPALVRFGGSPEVDKDNNLIYRFPSLQKTGRRQVGLCPHAVSTRCSQWCPTYMSSTASMCHVAQQAKRHKHNLCMVCSHVDKQCILKSVVYLQHDMLHVTSDTEKQPSASTKRLPCMPKACTNNSLVVYRLLPHLQSGLRWKKNGS